MKDLATQLSPQRISVPDRYFPFDEFVMLLENHIESPQYEIRDTFSPFPVLIQPGYLKEDERLCKVLNKALIRIVNNYFADERIRNIYQLDPELQSILKMAENCDYKVGFYRPDFVYDQRGQKRICEIGARYPINGWMFSYYQNLAVKVLAPKESPDWSSIPGQNDFLNHLGNHFDPGLPIVLVHEKEKGTEVYNLFDELKTKGFSFVSASPQDLKLMKGDLFTKDGDKAAQLILEMDREELKTFDPAILKTIVNQSNYFNDVRTLILVHDKRVLAVLYDEQIMLDYLSKEEYAFLRNFLIPSYSIQSKQMGKSFPFADRDWVLKRSSGGRGVGMLIKSECPPQEWEQTLENEGQHYMIQEFIDQETFRFGTPIGNLVGMFLCWDDRSYGPGVFRGSSEKVINVADGRAYLHPCVLDLSSGE